MSKKLTRRTDDKMIGGVCAGVASYFDVDVNLVRVVTVLITVLGAGSLVLVYLAAWILLPPAASVPAQWDGAPEDR